MSPELCQELSRVALNDADERRYRSRQHKPSSRRYYELMLEANRLYELSYKIRERAREKALERETAEYSK